MPVGDRARICGAATLRTAFLSKTVGISELLA